RPIPLPAPVTMATFPVRFGMRGEYAHGLPALAGTGADPRRRHARCARGVRVVRPRARSGRAAGSVRLAVAPVALEVARARDPQPRLDVGLDALQRPGWDVARSDPRRQLALRAVVLGRELRQLAVDDPERVHRDERPEAEAVIPQRREDLVGEEVPDCLGELLGGGALADSSTLLS